MSAADALIAGLSDGGELDSEGAFSLDRDKAREKMRQFQLADPHRYVLLLVEAAVLRGASSIVFEIDTDDMYMRFDAALSWADLDELYAALFVNRSSVEIRSRRELALAFNAVMALNPRWVKVVSVGLDADGQPQAVAAELRSDAADDIRTLDEIPSGEGMKPPWTRIHVKERFRPGLLVRFLNDISGSVPEELLIHTRCRFATTSIVLDDAQVSHGLPSGLVGGVRFELEHLRGVAGLTLEPERSDRSAVVLLSNGVDIATHELGASVDGLWYWVDASNFRKDVSQGDIVRSDPAYQDMLRAIAGARDQVLGNLGQLWAAGQFNESSKPSSTEVFELLRKCFIQWADAQWLRPDAGALGQLAAMPLWRTVDQQWLSPRALVEQADKLRGVMYTERDFEGVTPRGWGPVIHVLGGQLEIDAISRVYPGAESATARLEREVPWELARRRWLARPHEIELPRADPWGSHRFEQGEFSGCVALRLGRLSDVRVVIDGCLLCELELELAPIGLSAVITGPIKPAASHLMPRTDRHYATLLLLLAAQLPRLLETWAQLGESVETLVSSLGRLSEREFPAQWLVAFGFTKKAADELLVRLGRPSLLPPMGLGPDQQASLIARTVTVPTADLRRVSLAALDVDRRERERERGKILIINSLAPTSPALDELIVHADAGCRTLLVAVFGASAIHDDTKAYQAELGRRQFEARPRRFPAPPATTWTMSVNHELDGGGRITGYVGVDAARVRERADRSRRVSIELFTRERSLCMVEEQTWLPGVDAQLAWDEAPVDREWTKLDGSTAPLVAALEQGLLSLIRARAESSMSLRPPDDHRRLLWLSIAVPFVSVEHFRCWRALRAAFPGDHEAAVAAYHAVIELFPGIPLPELRESITLLCDDGKLPSRENLLALMGRNVAPPGGGREFHRELLRMFAVLEVVPLVELTSGQTACLSDLVELFEANGEIAYVADRSLRFSDDEYLIVREDPIDQVALARLFGSAALKEVSAWVHERRNQQRFEARTQLEHMRVPNERRLVGVEFEREGFVGELAIPPWTAGDGSMRLTYCHERRVVEDIELHATLPVVGIVDDPEAPLDAGFSKVETNHPRVAALRKLLDAVLGDQLLPTLAVRYAELDSSQQQLAWTWIATLWRRQSPRAGQHPERLTAAGRSFAALDLFVDVDGTHCSLEQLIERNREQRCLWYVERRPDHQIPPPFPILLPRADQLRVLEHLFPQLSDFSARWNTRVVGHQRRLAAEDMPALVAPPEHLVAVELDRHGLSGVVWLPDRHPFAGGIVIGVDGKFVEALTPIEQLPALGLVGGEIEADDGFTRAELSGPARRYLDSRVFALYSALINEHMRELARPDKVDFVDTKLAQRRAIRFDMLRSVTLSLCRASASGVRFDAILGNLYRRLCEQPLMRLSSGKLISVELARKARPQELAHLGLWDPNAPPVDIGERARLLLGEDAVVPSGDDASADEPDEADQPDQQPSEAADEQGADTQAATPSQGATAAEHAAGLDALSNAMGGLVDALGVELIDVDGDDDELDMLASVLSGFQARSGELDIPPPPPPEPDPVDVLLERIRDELRLLRERHTIMLSEGMLDKLQAESGRGRELVTIDNRVLFDSAHPRFVRALKDPDPIWVSFLASVAYTALNRWLDEVTDDHEQDFHAAHASLLLTALLE